jgi:hypothetical protein
VHHEVTVVTTPPTPTAVIAQATTWDEFPGLWGTLLSEVWEFLRGAAAGADLSPGRNVMLYKDAVPNVEIGVEVAKPFARHGRVVSSTLPTGQAARSVSRGAPSIASIEAAHDAVHDWCAANRRTPTGVRWEIYDHWRDDPDAFETEIYWLLEPSSLRSSAS